MQRFPSVISRITRHLFLYISIIIALVLAYSVCYSGYWYSFYGDELVTAHLIYLISHGYKPFTDFFTIYSPVFHYVMSPVFLFLGFSLEAIQYSRAVMIVLFGFRLFLGWKLARKVFSATTATIFVYLMLLDSLIIFTSMQLRPDNLLMIVFTAALISVVSALEEKTGKKWLLTGILTGLSLTVSVKIASCVIVMSMLLLVFCFRKNLVRQFVLYVLGVGISLGAFVLFFVLQGSGIAMAEHLITYSKATIDALMYPTRFGFFYNPNNAIVFGIWGKPVTWYITVILPVAGIFGIVFSFLRWRKQTVKRWVIALFALMLLAQYLFFQSVKAMFLQYYLTFDWILAFFTAEFIHIVFLSLKKPRGVAVLMQCILCIFFAYLVYASFPANIGRGRSVSTVEAEKRMKESWEIVPEDQPVYPGMLFRPMSQPISYGFFLPEIPDSIKNHYPSSYDVLKDKHIRYLSLSDYELQFMDSKTVTFIEENYIRLPKGNAMWILKE